MTRWLVGRDVEVFCRLCERFAGWRDLGDGDEGRFFEEGLSKVVRMVGRLLWMREREGGRCRLNALEVDGGVEG